MQFFLVVYLFVGITLTAAQKKSAKSLLSALLLVLSIFIDRRDMIAITTWSLTDFLLPIMSYTRIFTLCLRLLYIVKQNLVYQRPVQFSWHMGMTENSLSNTVFLILQCTSLQKIDYESVVIVTSKDSHAEMGSETGRKFIEHFDLVMEFLNYHQSKEMLHACARWLLSNAKRTKDLPSKPNWDATKITNRLL